MTENNDKHTAKDDDEVAIDFSKIGNLFKKPAHHEHKTHHDNEKHEHHAPAHEHKGSHEPEHKKAEKKKEKEDINWNFKETATFFKKYGTYFLILIPIILTIFLRLQPMYLPTTDDWAENSVNSFYRNQVVQQVNAQYPNLPDANKQALIESELQRLLSENKGTIDQQIAGASQQFKERLMYESGDSKYVYLGDIDSYYWLREARKIVETGTPCDEVNYENNLCYRDTYTRAPVKHATDLDKTKTSPYVYAIVYTYKTLGIFNPDITIMQASFYVPLIFGVLSAILAFLIGRLIAGNVAGLVTSIFISVNPIHLSRTLGSDNDPQNIFFPLLAVLFFLYTFKAETLKKKLIFGTLTGVAISFYAVAWTGWWFIFNAILVTLIIYLGFIIVRELMRKKNLTVAFGSNETKSLLAVIGTILVSSALFTTILAGFNEFAKFVTGPLWFTKAKDAALATFWPNVLVTVAEFNPGSIPTIIGQMGGKLIFFLGMMAVVFMMVNKESVKKEQKYLLTFGALVYLFLSSSYGASLQPITYMILLALPVIAGMIMLLKSKEEVDAKLAILLVIWFVGTTYAALKGVRFTLLMVSAFGVAFGITIAYIYHILSRWISRELKINEILTKTVVAIILLLVLISPVKAGYNVATNFIPSVNDAWYSSLTKINDNSEPDAIINSWWDFGHWFKYLADRRVTLDGSSQSGPPLHWLGKLMVADDEKHSVGILRMLDCGSNNAYDELNAVIDDVPRSIDILDTIVKMDKADAGRYLIDNGLTKDQATHVLKQSHCEPPENFFITSEDMVGKAGVWSHFGSWDFKRSEMYNRVRGTSPAEGKQILLEPKFNLTPEQADQYYYEIQSQSDSEWITPWPGYLSSVRNCDMPNSAGIMLCNQQISGGQQLPFAVNLSSMDVIIAAQGDPKPYSIVYVTENGTEEKLFEGNTLGFSVVLLPRGEAGYASVLTHPYLANSMFTRLFYMEGHGLSYFDKFDDQNGVTGGRILVWKVDWEGTDANEVYKAVAAGKNETEETVIDIPLELSEDGDTATAEDPVTEDEEEDTTTEEGLTEDSIEVEFSTE